MDDDTASGPTDTQAARLKCSWWLAGVGLSELNPSIVAIVPNDEMEEWNRRNYPHGYNLGLERQ